jgi:hypothetical protein
LATGGFVLELAVCYIKNCDAHRPKGAAHIYSYAKKFPCLPDEKAKEAKCQLSNAT